MSKLVIEIENNNLCKAITIDEHNIKTNRYIEYSRLIELLIAAQKEVEKDSSTNYELSDILPGDNIISTIQVKNLPGINSKWYILLREKTYHDMELRLRGKVYNFKNVGLPRILFAIKVCNNKCVNFKIFCVKEKDAFITNETKLYKYPFSNVFHDGSVCLGNNSISSFQLKSINNIILIPEMFLSMPNSDHAYSNKKPYNEFLEELQDKKFDDNLLECYSPNRNYIGFINNLM